MELLFANMRSNMKWNIDGDMLWGYFFHDRDHEKGLKWKQTKDIAIETLIREGKIVKWGDWMGMSKLLKERGIDRSNYEIKDHMNTKKFGGKMKTLLDKLPKSAIVTATRKRRATKTKSTKRRRGDVVAASNTSARVQKKAKISYDTNDDMSSDDNSNELALYDSSNDDNSDDTNSN